MMTTSAVSATCLRSRHFDAAVMAGIPSVTPAEPAVTVHSARLSSTPLQSLGRGAEDESMAKQRFQDLPPWRKAILIVMGTIQISLFAAAQYDIAHRSDSQVRGSKKLWRAVSFVNIFGPLAYFRWGRIGDRSKS